MHIQLSSATYEHLKGSHFIFERRGIITIKVKGQNCNHGNYIHQINCIYSAFVSCYHLLFEENMIPIQFSPIQSNSKNAHLSPAEQLEHIQQGTEKKA